MGESQAVHIRSHRDLIVWEKAVGFAVDVYRATEALPKSEIYGLTAQVRRASTSIAANIAEGRGRRSTPDLLHFLAIAKGSLRETDTLLEIIGRLDLGIEATELQSKGQEVGRFLSALTRSLKS